MTHGMAMSSRQNLTSADPAQGPARTPTQNHMPCTAKNKQTHATAQHPVESDNEIPLALTRGKYGTYKSFHNDESADNISCHSNQSNTSDSNGSDFSTAASRPNCRALYCTVSPSQALTEAAPVTKRPCTSCTG